MINEQGFVVKSLAKAIDRSFSYTGRRLRPVEFLTPEEVKALPAGDVFVFDVECYSNFFYVAFKHLKSGKFVEFELSPDRSFNPLELLNMLWRFCVVGFNSTSYDIPIIEVACKYMNNAVCKAATDFIIQSGINYGTKKTTPYDVEREYKVKIGRYNHIDLFNVCPVNGGLTATPASLKLYAARLHSEKLQDLPFEPSRILTKEEAEVLKPYCCNDLDNTELLFKKLASEIELRVEMSDEYSIDLRSRSDAQVAEAVINSELEKVLGYYPKKPDSSSVPDSLKYNVPDFICFQTPQLKSILEKLRDATFYLDAAGSPLWPDGLGEVEKIVKGVPKYALKCKLGEVTYKLGMGGLHSDEKKVGYVAGDGWIIADNDVESFYPRTILNQRLYPDHLGEAFLTVYDKIVQTRIHAKHMAKSCKAQGDKKAAKKWKSIADSLKIVINGSFGKLGNKYSTFYAPQLMLQVTITGQLVLLMLIEALELAGVKVVSGNTDGVVSYYHESRHADVRAIIEAWEAHTNYKTEETQYAWIYSRDVNSYAAGKLAQDDAGNWLPVLAGDPEGAYLDDRLGVKTKGAYSEKGSALNSVLSKNPEALVCSDAVIRFLCDGTPIEKTVRETTDPRRFVVVANVRGGGHVNGQYLGKVVRFYYGKDKSAKVQYVGSGNQVGGSLGAIPMMDLADVVPADLDYSKYVDKAIEMLYDCGRLKKTKSAAFNFF